MSGTDIDQLPAATLDDGSPTPTERALLPPLDVDEDALRRGVAAVLFIADEPLTVEVIAETLGVDPGRIAVAVGQVATELDAERIGFELRDVAGGWRMMTSPTARPVLERWLIGARHGRLTQAALETLAVVAYRQPIARLTIGEIRGVNPDGALRSLVSRGLVTEVGREDGPGQAVLFGTTPQFLERMGLRSLAELPPLPGYLPDGPAPDEPDAGALAALRRRLREGSQRLGAGPIGVAEGFQPTLGGDEDEDDGGLPAPRAARPRDDEEIGELSERLEQAARNAMGRLRRMSADSVSGGETRIDESSSEGDPDGASDE